MYIDLSSYRGTGLVRCIGHKIPMWQSIVFDELRFKSISGLRIAFSV